MISCVIGPTTDGPSPSSGSSLLVVPEPFPMAIIELVFVLVSALALVLTSTFELVINRFSPTLASPSVLTLGVRPVSRLTSFKGEQVRYGGVPGDEDILDPGLDGIIDDDPESHSTREGIRLPLRDLDLDDVRDGPGRPNLESGSSSSSFPDRSSSLNPLCPANDFETRTVVVELDEAIRSNEGEMSWVGLGLVVVVLERERERVGVGLVGVVRVDEDETEGSSIGWIVSSAAAMGRSGGKMTRVEVDNLLISPS